MYKILTETHQLFDVMLISQVKKIGLSKYKYVILPNTECIDQETASILDEFVSQGNHLLATGNTSYFDKHLEERTEPALQCLGIDSAGANRNVRGAYFTFQDKQAFKRFAVCDLVNIEGDYVYANYSNHVEKCMKLLPPQPFGPPERCYPLISEIDRPAVAINKFGQGTAIHIPWFPGRYFYRQGYLNTFNFLADVFEHILGLQPVEGNISPTVEATLLKTEDESIHIFHLINNNGHYGNCFFEPTTINGIMCRIPYSESVSSVISLVDSRQQNFTYENGFLTIEIDQLNKFEALLIQ